MTACGEPIYLNGRFLTQTLTGVQRFATEISAALHRLRAVEITTLVPAGTPTEGGSIRSVGRHDGHLWEQLDLPRHVRDGILVNLTNTAPLRLGRQVVVVHDAGIFRTPEDYSWKFRAWYTFLQRRLVRAGAQLVTVSEFSRSEIVRFLGASAERVAVVREGADHMHRIVAEPAVLAASGLAPGRFVLAVGSLSKHKNLGALRELALLLANRNMTLVIAGGLAPGVFQRQGNDVQLPHPARYIGRVSDGELKALYEAAACFVFPSRYEGFGLPAVEAMACGCLVAAADIPALRETCGEAAIYCAVDSPADIARQVCRVLDEEDVANQLRQAAAARVSEYTWDRAARAFDGVIAAASACRPANLRRG
jgi:glycosyltransferase involved in cell wall biosynthesis